ncbi:MAG: FAD-binding protein [Candidatus Daviesbacteria bacterium]|nr:FAD-binding protein [Candidatus Daviesbacteria bacterium]
MDSKFKLIIDSFGKDRFKVNEPVKDYTSSGIGGPAKLFFIAFSVSELVKIISMCRQLKLPFFIFGTGTKMMISDSGFDGLVIKNRTKEIEVISIKGKVSKLGIGIEEALVEVESGVSMAGFMEFLETKKLEAAEFKNIPGTVGGNLFLSNILQNRIKSIKILTSASQIEEIEAKNLNLKKHIVLSAIFKIKAI